MTTALAQHIAPMTPAQLDRVRRFEAINAELPQVDIETEHVLHAGMYARTITIPAGVALTGALIKVATILIVNGDCDVFMGTRTMRLVGYHVLEAAAQRKGAFYAHKDTHLTMIFPTDAATVQAAEEEFTDEADRLMSRRQGDLTCQEQ